MNNLLIPDLYWGILTVAQEARSEPFEGMVGVAEVIRNRTESKFYSSGTIASTVLWPYQFSGWNTTDKNRLICAGLELTDSVVRNILNAFDTVLNKRSDNTQGAVSYHGNYMNIFPNWALSSGFKKTVMIGRHIFYRRA